MSHEFSKSQIVLAITAALGAATLAAAPISLEPRIPLEPTLRGLPQSHHLLGRFDLHAEAGQEIDRQE